MIQVVCIKQVADSETRVKIGRVARDQVTDYAARKGIEVAEAERWLTPNLAYNPPVAAGSTDILSA